MIESKTFKVGDHAVYPGHGLVVIKRIDEREVGGKKKLFYVLLAYETKMTIMLPVDNATAVGLRVLISEKEVQNVFEILKKPSTSSPSTWNLRFREYMEKIKTGSAYEIAEVLRDLYMLRQSKDLSFGERKMIDQAKSLLVNEISIVRGQEERVTEQEINSIFTVENSKKDFVSLLSELCPEASKMIQGGTPLPQVAEYVALQLWLHDYDDNTQAGILKSQIKHLHKTGCFSFTE